MSFERIGAGFFFLRDVNEFYSYLSYLVSDLSKIRCMSANNVVENCEFRENCLKEERTFPMGANKIKFLRVL